MRAYAIGDIHGQIDLLHAAHARVAADRAEVGDADSPLVHVGDLTDRGPESRAVVDYLIKGHAQGQPWITLKGNHDNMFAMFLDDPFLPDPGLRAELHWLNPRLGGNTTLASYSIEDADKRMPDDVHAEAIKKVPKSHHAFLSNLPTSHRAAGALFVHAGIRPGIPLDKQLDEDLMWIRKPFHEDSRDHGLLVVHGHTPVKEAMHYGNRVNIDTGAAYGGPLTAIVVEDGEVHVLTDQGRIPLTPSEPKGLAKRLLGKITGR